jgi:CRP-like cAMP-binding protein
MDKSAEQTKPSESENPPSKNAPSGLGRTLSTEFMAQESAIRALEYINGLFETQTWSPGEVIIRKGNRDRDLFLVTKGIVEIWTEEEAEQLILNEIEAPHILGDVAFLSGLPRSATAKAKTEVKSFVLKHRNFERIFKGSPKWLSPVVNSLVSGLKSLHYQVEELRER